jgi:hypothetical protein
MRNNIVDCLEVYDCHETYPTFCEDAFDWCYNGPVCGGMPDWYSCEDYGGCYAECDCALSPY